MNTFQVALECPYCTHTFEIAAQIEPSPPLEVMAVPYTRDVGRFDPHSEEEQADPRRWSRIGKDYLSWLQFERYGILRALPEEHLKIWYRVQSCPNCHYLFDLYLNYTPGKRFQTFWPHVFGIDKNNPSQFQVYQGESIPVWVTRRLGKPFGAAAWGAVLVGGMAFFVSLLPWILQLLARFLGQNITGIPSLFPSILLYLVAACGMIVILIQYEKAVRFQNNLTDLTRLFRVKSKNGIIHWHNYTLSRFVGVQTGKGFPALSQVDIYTGSLAIITLVIARFWQNYAWLYLLSILAGFAIAIGAGRLATRVIKHTKYASQASRFGIIVGFVILAVIPTYFLVRWAGLPADRRWLFIFQFTDLLFWVAVAYLLGIAALMALNSALYILKGVAKIPMRVNPFSKSDHLKPIMNFRNFSTQMMMTLFMILIGLVSILETFKQVELFPGTPYANTVENFYWLEEWLMIALVVIFGGMTFASQKRYAVIVLLYFILEFLIPFPDYKLQISGINWFIDANLLILGGFLTILFAYHSWVIHDTIEKIKNRSRESAILAIENEIAEVYARIENQQFSGSLREADLLSYAHTARSITDLIRLKEELTKLDHSKPFSLLGVISPIMWSLILPSLWSALVDDQIRNFLKGIFQL